MFDRQKDRQDKAVPPSSPAPSERPANPTGSMTTSGSRSTVIATIGASIRIKGDVSGDEDLRIEGTIEGTIKLAAHELLIGQSGKVIADINAKIVRVHGEVQGDITGRENVIISSTSNVRGNVVTPRMTLEDGARFKGSIDIDPDANTGKHTGSTKKPIDISSRIENAEELLSKVK
jgi:cytoskeletal protein CcmA (bactofilin family)